MAASHGGSTVPNTPLLGTFNLKDVSERSALPTGPCNYTNLSVGGNAPRCGCRRFWNQASRPEGGNGRRGWCMCEHHACFHDHGPSEMHGSLDWDEMLKGLSRDGHTSPLLAQPAPAARIETTLKGIQDTIQWNRLGNSGPESGLLPSIPSQCLLPSENGSVTSTEQARYLRPFAGAGLGTLSHIPKPQLARAALGDQDIIQVYEDAAGIQSVQSPTDVATPFRDMFMDLDGRTALNNKTAVVDPNIIKSSLISQTALQDGVVQVREEPVIAIAATEDLACPSGMQNLVTDYPVTKQDHERRLDLLENASFTHPALEELEEIQENLDTRVVELEERVLDIEKANTADQVSVSNRQDESFASRNSSTIERHDIASKIHVLESQVADIQALMPSLANPWEVEVVLLPFGSSLMGLWSPDMRSTQHQRTCGTSTEILSPTQALLAVQGHDSAWLDARSDTYDEDYPWLFPRACGPRSLVYQRLRSRGLVRNITICGPGYRDVQDSIIAAFGDVSSLMYPSSPDVCTYRVPPELAPYHGLSPRWIPLRKHHKDSCLRYLDPAEMLTPALWSVSFLYTSVAMRTPGVRRLYFTQPDSYIQDVDSVANWTWHKLRQLPRFYPEARSSPSHTPEADAQEACWEYNAQLDSNLSAHSSMSSHPSLSIRIPLDDPSSSSPSPLLAAAPQGLPTPNSDYRPILTALHQRCSLRPLHARTTSMPVMRPSESPTLISTAKRRIISCDQSPTRSVPDSAALKRRRISHSHAGSSVRMSRTPRNTPRVSVPLSPYTLIDEGNPTATAAIDRDAGQGRESKRGATPTAYATPFSNAPYVSGDDGNDGSATDEVFGLEEEDVDEFDDSDDDDVQGEDMRSSPASECNLTQTDPQYAQADDSNDSSLVGEEWQGVQDPPSSTGANHPQSIHPHSCPDDHSALEGLNIYEDPDPDIGVEEGVMATDGAQSDASSSPSEYPSTLPHPLQEKTLGVAFAKGGRGFWIHVDEDGDDHGL